MWSPLPRGDGLPVPVWHASLLRDAFHKGRWALQNFQSTETSLRGCRQILRCLDRSSGRIPPQQGYYASRLEAGEHSSWRDRLPQDHRLWSCEDIRTRLSVKDFLRNSRVPGSWNGASPRSRLFCWLVGSGHPYLRDANWCDSIL